MLQAHAFAQIQWLAVPSQYLIRNAHPLHLPFVISMHSVLGAIYIPIWSQSAPQRIMRLHSKLRFPRSEANKLGATLTDGMVFPVSFVLSQESLRSWHLSDYQCMHARNRTKKEKEKKWGRLAIKVYVRKRNHLEVARDMPFLSDAMCGVMSISHAREHVD